MNAVRAALIMSLVIFIIYLVYVLYAVRRAHSAEKYSRAEYIPETPYRMRKRYCPEFPRQQSSARRVTLSMHREAPVPASLLQIAHIIETQPLVPEPAPVPTVLLTPPACDDAEEAAIRETDQRIGWSTR